mmetsp:Transcript_37066/g.88524  ORF Transcript_37066/g.88524 Transcript_37066/m.88524 type:complete len:86 (+) Transcript_37066:118-375(+)
MTPVKDKALCWHFPFRTRRRYCDRHLYANLSTSLDRQQTISKTSSPMNLANPQRRLALQRAAPMCSQKQKGQKGSHRAPCQSRVK